MQRTRSNAAPATTTSSTAVSGLNASPTPSPAPARELDEAAGSSVTSWWKVTLSPPASAICGMCRSGLSTIRWQSIAAAALVDRLRDRPEDDRPDRDRLDEVPVADVEVEDPDAGVEQRLDLRAEPREVGRVERRLDLRPAQPGVPGHARILATKKPDVRWTCGSVRRNSGRRGWRKPGQSAPRSSNGRPTSSTTASFSASWIVQTAYVTLPPGRTRSRGDREQRPLQIGQRGRAPTQVGPRGEHAQSGARRVDEHAVEPRVLGGKLERVGVDDRDVREAEPRGVLGELARASLVDLDRDDLGRRPRRAGSSCRRAPRRGRGSARPAARRRRDRRAGSRGSAARRIPARATPAGICSTVCAPGRSGSALAGELGRAESARTTVGGGSFPAAMSARAASRPCSRQNVSAIQSGYEWRSAASAGVRVGQRGERARGSPRRDGA